MKINVGAMMVYEDFKKWENNLPRGVYLDLITRKYGYVFAIHNDDYLTGKLLPEEPLTAEERKNAETFVEENKNIRVHQIPNSNGVYIFELRESVQHEAVIIAIQRLVGKIQFEKEWVEKELGFIRFGKRDKR